MSLWYMMRGSAQVQFLYHLHGEDFMKARPDKNSATSAVAGFAGVIDDAILPPAGVELRSDKEHLIWNQFTRARARKIGVTWTLFCWLKS